MQIEDTLWCDGCGIEILSHPVIVGDRSYCCQDCADGYECDCQPEMEIKENEF